MKRLGSMLLVAALSFTSSGAGPPISTLCSIVPFPSHRDVEATYFLGVGQPDTVLAGRGEVVIGGRPGHWGRGEREAIYGQVVTVQRLGGADSTRVAEVLAGRGSNRVLVVPWDYDAGCETAAWSRSARFAPVDTTGMFTLRLRPEEHWPGGVPTFDAFMADLEPYPHGLFFRRGYRGTDALTTQPSLTPGQFFELYGGLPDGDLIRSDPAAAEAKLELWIEENPLAARAYPAPRILEWARVVIGQSAGARSPGS